jgi:acyl-CoA reductase-like NAD-dependent aldehyde dehydrogenase
MGGKDAAIVCRDAKVERAVKGVVNGCMFNTGQFCCGIERCYVHEDIAEEFIAGVVQEVRNLKQHWDGSQDISSMITPDQIGIIEEHVQDAIDKGAKVLIGGKQNEHFEGAAYEPTVLVDVNHSMLIMKDETFGPVLPIMVVKDENEAIALANDSRYGLSGTVWTKDKKKGLGIAKQMETGSVCVNETALTYGAHNAPFGGVKNSGVGYVHGKHAIRKFTQPVPVIIDRFGMKTEQNWYPLDEDLGEGMQKFVKKFFGSKLLRWLA